MAASGKFDLSSGSPDRSLYASGSVSRGSHAVTSLDRSNSSREGMDNPILSSLPSMSRSSSAVAQTNVSRFLQCLPPEAKSVAADHKVIRQGDLKRQISSALGLSLDDTPPTSSKGKQIPSQMSDDIKRARSALREGSSRARDRMKIYTDALLTFNKFFPSIPSKKRSRLDTLYGDRSNVSPSHDRSILGPNTSKMGSQNHAITNGFDLEQQKSEERIRGSVPSKRTRTSLVDVKMDVRQNVLVRQSGTVEKDREVLRLPNGGSVQGEERPLSIGVEGWEKSKMKKKRSGIKPDVITGKMSTKPIEGYRESKQGLQQRLVPDARSRLNDSHGFRPGVANGAVGLGKAESNPQQAGSAIRSSTPRTDQDNNSLLADRRDRPIGPDRDRANMRAVNKANIREDFSSVSPTSNMKVNATARAPRSGSSMVPKLSPVVHRAAAPNDWELPYCTSKPPAVVGVNNRKRTASARASSPPVANWAGQRSQKSSRIARRTNFVPIVSSAEETPTLDTVSDVAGNENNSGFNRGLANNSPQQIKLKGDHYSSAALSESEESAAADMKLKDKVKKSDEMGEKAGQNVQKVSTLVPSSKKNKIVNGEDLGDGVRKQGRPGRGFTSARSLMPMTVEKISNMGTAKQLRSSRLGVEKNERAGRPPTRKLSDRKAYTRQRHTSINASADFLVGSDDGHEELLAAANAVINPHSFSSLFWKHMDPFFKFIFDADINYLRQQGNIVSTAHALSDVPLDVGGCVPDEFGLIECKMDMGYTADTKSREAISKQLASGTKVDCVIPLCQRLIAALISEEENEEFYCSSDDYLKFDVSGTGVDAELETISFNHQKSVEFPIAGCGGSNGYTGCGNGTFSDNMGHDDLEYDMAAFPNLGHSQNGVLSEQALVPNITYSEFRYNKMSINEKVLLEIQSIGIFPEMLPDVKLTEGEEISETISKLENRYHEQVSKNQCLLGKLLKSASKATELQEKEFEHRALDKLVGMAYEKYMTCWGPNASGGKSSSSKMAKHAALAFVKRTLERCQKFEDTGKSCFSEPLFRDMFLSGSSQINDAEPVHSVAEVESAKSYINISSHPMDARVSASMGSLQSPSLTSRLGHNIDNHDAYSSDLPVNQFSEQRYVNEETWSNRVKNRELLLDDVGVTTGTSSSTPSGIGSSISSNTKGKRSDRDREGKGQREVSSRNGTNRVGRPALSNIKGERKSKAKPKQRTQLSASVNGLLGKMSEQPKAAVLSVPKSTEMIISSNPKEKNEFGLDVLNNSEPVDLSVLQLSGMDGLSVPGDLDGQAEDLSSWLNIDDEGLQDDDFMGLEIPMDDLSDLNMMV